jgi:uncharacterized protein (UPF0332 family)
LDEGVILLDSKLQNAAAKLWLYKAKDECDTALLCMSNKRYSAVVLSAYGSLLFSFQALLALKGIEAKKAVTVLREAYKQHSGRLEIPQHYMDAAVFLLTEKHMYAHEESYEIAENTASMSVLLARQVYDGISERVSKAIHMSLEVTTDEERLKNRALIEKG